MTRDGGATVLGYIKKFLLDNFPSLIATIIGAYIVHHYVIPAAAPKPAASATATTDPAATISPIAVSPARASFEKAVAEKAAIEKTAEKASEKSGETPVEAKRRHAGPRVAGRGNVAAPEATGSVDSAPVEERRDANDLARAAIERLRHSSGESARAVPAMQPLPPAVALTKGPDVFNGGAEAAVTLPARHSEFARTATAAKLTPPAEIPGAGPIELHADAQAGDEKPSMADNVMSAAKSVFHAVVPR